MKLVQEKSLLQTLDKVNELLFFDKPLSMQDAKQVVNFIRGRQGKKGAYANGFAITEWDEESDAWTFTGEPLVSKVSRRHIATEEASRLLIILTKKTGQEVPELKKANKGLLEKIAYVEYVSDPEGFYCCGLCTAGLWRHVAAGGLKSYSHKLDKGLDILKSLRDKGLGWKRFPFYYTVLALTEMKNKKAKEELRYVMPVCERRIKTLKDDSTFTRRRKKLLETVLAF